MFVDAAEPKLGSARVVPDSKNWRRPAHRPSSITFDGRAVEPNEQSGATSHSEAGS
jgi:hypothetical protein